MYLMTCQFAAAGGQHQFEFQQVDIFYYHHALEHEILADICSIFPGAHHLTYFVSVYS